MKTKRNHLNVYHGDYIFQFVTHRYDDLCTDKPRTQPIGYRKERDERVGYKSGLQLVTFDGIWNALRFR